MDGLLELIAASPDEDAHRLVYADLLSDRGDPRGEFIALQIQRARFGLTSEEEALERELLARHRSEWLGALEPVIESSRFRRGFLSACTVRFESNQQMEALANHPAWATVERLAGDVSFATVGAFRALHTIGPCDLAQLTPLWKRAALPSITELIVRTDELAPDAARFLGDARPFPRLKRLGLMAEDLISPYGLRFLMAGRRARRLEKLAVRARELLSDLAVWWEQCKELHELAELTLEPVHGVRYRFFRERELWSLEIVWRSDHATGDLFQIQRSLHAVPSSAFHRVVVKPIGTELPHHRSQLNRVLGRFPRLVFASAA